MSSLSLRLTPHPPGTAAALTDAEARPPDHLDVDKKELERELKEELQFHRNQLQRDAMAEGADPSAARNIATRRLGNLTRVVEDVRELLSRAERAESRRLVLRDGAHELVREATAVRCRDSWGIERSNRGS